MDFSKVTDPIKCLNITLSSILEFSHIQSYLNNNSLSSLRDLMMNIRRRQLSVILILDTPTRDIAKLVSPDLVFYIEGISDRKDIDYYLSTQTPIVLMVKKENMEASLNLGKKYNLILLVDAEIPIQEIENYNIDKSKVFYRNLPLCIADDYQVYSTLSMLNTVSEIAEGDRIKPLDIKRELFYYSKHKECLGCSLPCLGKRKGDALHLIPTDTKEKLEYHSLMGDTLCKRFPKVIGDILNPYDELSWIYPLSETFKSYRIKNSPEGENYCYVSRIKETFFYCRRKGMKEMDFETREGKIFWNCLFLNRRDPALEEKSNYDLIIPKDSITVLIKIETKNKYTLSEIKEIKEIPIRTLKHLLNGFAKVEEINGSIFVNDKKVLGRESIISPDGYIENMCIYSTLKEEEHNFNLMRNKGDFNSRAGITDIVPEISSEIIYKNIYKAYSEFFDSHRNRLNNFRIKIDLERKNSAKNAQLLGLQESNVIEIVPPTDRILENSRTLYNKKSFNPDILGSFNASFIRNLQDKEIIFLMNGIWDPADLIRPENEETIQIVLSKGYRFIIYFLHNKCNMLSLYIWSKSDEDIKDEIEKYRVSYKYEILDLRNGFFEIKEKLNNV